MDNDKGACSTLTKYPHFPCTRSSWVYPLLVMGASAHLFPNGAIGHLLLSPTYQPLRNFATSSSDWKDPDDQRDPGGNLNGPKGSSVVWGARRKGDGQTKKKRKKNIWARK